MVLRPPDTLSIPIPPQKNKKTDTEKAPLYFQKWSFLALILKKCLYFLNEKGFLYFVKREPFLYFPKRKHFYIPRNRTLHFSAHTWKIKTLHPRKQKWSFLIFWKIERSSPKLSFLLIF